MLGYKPAESLINEVAESPQQESIEKEEKEKEENSSRDSRNIVGRTAGKKNVTWADVTRGNAISEEFWRRSCDEKRRIFSHSVASILMLDKAHR